MIYHQYQVEFYNFFVPLVLDVGGKMGIPRDALVALLGQLYIESAAQDPKDGIWKPGISLTCARANNPLGMRWFKSIHQWDPVKCTGDLLPPFLVATNEFKDGHLVEEEDQAFRHFESLRDAIVAWCLMIQKPGYDPARRAIARATVEKPGWMLFAEALGPKTSTADQDHCGYSTNPSYSAELIQIVYQFRLWDPRSLEWFRTGTDPGSPQISQISQIKGA
jgi:hypothetical protein